MDKSLGRFEIVEVIQGLADEDVPQDRPAQVHQHAGPVFGLVGRDGLADRPAVIQGAEGLEAFRPITRRDTGEQVEFACFEGLELDRAVAIILVSDRIEVVKPDILREVAGPIVVDPFVADGAAGIEIGDAVGATAQRRFQAGAAEVAVRPPMRRKDREGRDLEDNVRVLLRRTGDPDRMVVERFDRLYVVVEAGAESRRAFFAQNLVSEHHVFGGDRMTVVEIGVVAQVEDRPGAVFGEFEGLRQVGVVGQQSFLGIGADQPVIEQRQPRRGIAADDVAVEAVE